MILNSFQSSFYWDLLYDQITPLSKGAGYVVQVFLAWCQWQEQRLPPAAGSCIACTQPTWWDWLLRCLQGAMVQPLSPCRVNLAINTRQRGVFFLYFTKQLTLICSQPQGEFPLYLGSRTGSIDNSNYGQGWRLLCAPLLFLLVRLPSPKSLMKY